MVRKFKTYFGQTILIAIGVVVAMFAVGLVFAFLNSDSENTSVASVLLTETPTPTQTPYPTFTPMPTYTPYPTPIPTPYPTSNLL